MIFDKKCCRCGYCCLAITCISGEAFYGATTGTCPGLSFNSRARAKCKLVKRNAVPVGDGCCIKARAYKDGVEFDFATLPNHLKRRAVADARRGGKHGLLNIGI